jgi:ornithine carbamoyltransferase
MRNEKLKHLLSLNDLTANDINEIIERGKWLKEKQKKGEEHHPLKGKTLAMVFEKSSTRTRVSFEVGMYQLGGHALNLTSQASQLGRGETYEDTARVLSRYVDGIMVRTFDQENVKKMAQASTVPVINGLTDLYHPCQVLADLMTVHENKESIKDCTIAYVGDGNNLANSWINAVNILGFELRVATPEGYEPSLKHEGVSRDPVAAVKNADVVNTDTWVSMGQEGGDVETKKKLFEPFQVNSDLMRYAKSDSIVMHCLPAHRGEEITDEVMDGPQSRIFDQAENRLHIQKAILEQLMG